MICVEFLKAFLGKIREVDPTIDKEFQMILKESLEILELSESEIAKAFFVNISTVKSWCEGINPPPKALRGMILQWLESTVARKINMFDRYKIQ